MPLNELCGLIEWVSNTLPLKVILEDQYKRKDNKKLYVSLARSETETPLDLHTSLLLMRRPMICTRSSKRPKLVDRRNKS